MGTVADPVDTDTAWMRRALELAELGRGTVSPNPLVGCVLIRDGVVVGEGYHVRAGEAHAEVAALEQAGTDAAGATAYVTLEPCDHAGRTGPCSTRLLDAGVERVVVAVEDPHPEAGRGAATLRAAGVPVDIGVGEGAARRQNEVFFHALAYRRPFVVAKAAVSVDGRIAAADGTSQWLTGEEARARAHRLRGEVDAVVVGSGTVLADDPHLTVRGTGEGAGEAAAGSVDPPLRVALDRRGRVPPGARMLDEAAPSLVLDSEDVGQAVARLWDRGVRSMLVEGGAQVVGAFLRAGLVDRLVVHVAPTLLGEAGRPMLVADGITTLTEAPRFRLDTVEQVGDDALLSLSPVSTGRAEEDAGGYADAGVANPTPREGG